MMHLGWIAYFIFAFVLASGMSLRAYTKGSLDPSGARAAFYVGMVSCTASFRFGLTLIAFFLSSSKINLLLGCISTQVIYNFLS